MSTNIVPSGALQTLVVASSITDGQRDSVGLDIAAIAAPRDDVYMAVEWTGGTPGGTDSVGIFLSVGFTGQFQSGENEGRIPVLAEPLLTSLPSYQTRLWSLVHVVGALPDVITLWVDNNGGSAITTVNLLYAPYTTENV